MEIPTIALMILSGGGGGSKFFGVAGAPFGGTTAWRSLRSGFSLICRLYATGNLGVICIAMEIILII